MSIHNDDRQYGSDEERAEWKRELISEYQREGAFDDDVDDDVDFCEWCPYSPDKCEFDGDSNACGIKDA
jgi:hypothetical protein